MNKYKGMLRIYTGEGADKKPEWCDYEENEWMRASEVEAELAKKGEEIAVAIETLKYYADEMMWGTTILTAKELASYAHEALVKIKEIRNGK